jgi:hypothetical protein
MNFAILSKLKVIKFLLDLANDGPLFWFFHPTTIYDTPYSVGYCRSMTLISRRSLGMLTVNDNPDSDFCVQGEIMIGNIASVDLKSQLQGLPQRNLPNRTYTEA